MSDEALHPDAERAWPDTASRSLWGAAAGLRCFDQRLFPAVASATEQNVLFNIGRAIGGFGLIVIGAIAGTYGFDMNCHARRTVRRRHRRSFDVPTRASRLSTPVNQ